MNEPEGSGGGNQWAAGLVDLHQQVVLLLELGRVREEHRAGVVIAQAEHHLGLFIGNDGDDLDPALRSLTRSGDQVDLAAREGGLDRHGARVDAEEGLELELVLLVLIRAVQMAELHRRHGDRLRLDPAEAGDPHVAVRGDLEDRQGIQIERVHGTLLGEMSNQARWWKKL